MDKKINDILLDLDENLDISGNNKIREVNIKHKFKTGINDIDSNLKKLDISCAKNIKICKQKTINFDSFIKNNKFKDVDISNKPSLLDKIILLMKGQITLGGKIIGKFNDKIIFSKPFIKKLSISFIFIFLFLGLTSFVIQHELKNGYNKLISIKNNSGNIEYIQEQVNSAKFDFIFANILFEPLKLIPNENIKNGYYLLQGGENLTKFLDKSIQSYLSINDFILKQGGVENIKLTNLLSNFKPELNKLNSLLYNVLVSYNKVNNIGNKQLNDKFIEIRAKIKKSYDTTNIINNDFDQLLSLLGHNKEKKYLVLFQNNDEIRATGGFIGSLATITIKKGQVIDFIKDDVYAYEWEINKIYKNKSKAPEGLNKITNTFGLRDANYFVDFESSSKSINFFLKKIGKDVDGIIYINQNTLLDFLDLTGPIYFSDLNEEITKENFSLIISTLVEAQSFKVGTLGTPKKILFDFANIFISKLKEDKNYFGYLDIILKNIKSRDIVIYSFNSEENNLLWKLGLNGKINYNETIDYNYPVYTSIGGNKSDRYIKLKYEKDIEQNFDCSIDTNLKINRTHFFSKFEEQKVNDLLDNYTIKDKTRKDILNIQGKGVNKTYTRVILPHDIVVYPNKGQKVEKYKNNTVVSFYTDTRVLESTNYNIKYRIINKNCKDYSYKFYKQPGIRNYSIKINNGKTIKNYNELNSDFIYKE